MTLGLLYPWHCTPPHPQLMGNMQKLNFVSHMFLDSLAPCQTCPLKTKVCAFWQVFNVVPTFLEVSLVAGILAYKCGPAFAGLTAGTITLYTLVTFGITSVGHLAVTLHSCHQAAVCASRHHLNLSLPHHYVVIFISVAVTCQATRQRRATRSHHHCHAMLASVNCHYESVLTHW